MTVIIKFGGNAMVDGEAMTAFIAGVKQLAISGAQPVVVHGGGPQISAGLKAAGITSEFKGGYRVTTAESVQVVRDVLVNEVNRELVELMNASEVSAISMPGDIDGLLTAEHRTVLVDGVQEDIGLVGEVVAVDASAIGARVASGEVPVISTAARALDGQLFNVNADTATSAVAIALDAKEMIMLTDVPGVYANWPDRDSLITRMTAAELTALLPKLESGMVPKMEACLRAIEGGIPTVRVVGNLSDQGTQVTK
ncbi:MAG: acetylglutamate kinase [Actinomycetota bacterium]|jgi:acetylglutamate kinase